MPRLKLSSAARSGHADPVREVIRQVRTTGVALGQLLRTAGRCDKSEREHGYQTALCLTVSRRKISGLMLEFSTSSPGRRQTIKLLLTGKESFIEVPGSERLVMQLRELAKCTQEFSRRPGRLKA